LRISEVEGMDCGRFGNGDRVWGYVVCRGKVWEQIMGFDSKAEMGLCESGLCIYTSLG